MLLLNAVSRKKESYLEIFFEIGENVIKNSLERCEAFTKKIQMDIVNDDLSKYDESELNIDDEIIIKCAVWSVMIIDHQQGMPRVLGQEGAVICIG